MYDFFFILLVFLTCFFLFYISILVKKIIKNYVMFHYKDYKFYKKKLENSGNFIFKKIYILH